MLLLIVMPRSRSRIHRVEDLVPKLPVLASAPQALDQAVGERGLPVVDVRDDAEVADVLHGGGGSGGGDFANGRGTYGPGLD